MTVLKRLRWATAALAAVVGVVAVGSAVFGDITANKPVTPAKPLAPPKQVDETARTVFTDKPVLAYQQADGTTAFAWQLKPDLPTAARPKDVAVMIDTSASQAGDPLLRAGLIVQALAAELSPNDRVDVWTVNLNHKDHTRSLTGGFKPADDKTVKKAIDSLAGEEYASGAVDLKAGIETVLGAFDQKAGRQQVVLYIGDGESAAGAKLDEGVRVALGRRMAEKNVQFFSVPLGLTIAANTLHGFGMLTGGTVVRVKEDLGTPSGRFDFVKRLKDAFDVPVLTPEKVTLAPAGTDLLPAQLPPLRADRPTLVMGSVKAGTDKLSVTVTGRVAGQPQTITQTDALPAPKADHYFLAAMLKQWQDGEAKNAPVVLPADRALAMASEQFRLYRDEFVELALQAITADKLDHAQKLFQAALKVDPEFPEAKAGDKAVGRIRSGEITKKDFNKQINLQVPADPQPAAPAPGGQAEVDAAARAQAARNAADAEARALVDETLRRVRQYRETDPDGAYDDLKRQREAIRSNDRLSAAVRDRLVGDLDSLMRDVSTRAVEIKRRNEAVRERISRARALLNEYDLQMAEEDRTKARIDRFRFLMSQARFELAYREAQVMEQERVSRGLSVPPEVYTTYRVGQSATQLREQRELKRLREDRFLITMLQVEKSFIPYPDEPPVHFPPATVWRELRERRAPYEFKNQGFGTNTPKSLLELRSIVEGTHDIPGVPKRVVLDNPVNGLDFPLVFDELERKFQRRIKFQIRDEMFRALAIPELEEIRKYKFKREQNLSGLTLGAFLDILLSEVKGSYIVRPEYIEITTAEQRLYQKVTRAFEIGDLALAVPNSINQQALNQNLAVFGAQLNNIGSSLGQANFQGAQIGGLNNQGQGFPGQPGGGLNLGAPGGGVGGQNLGQLGCQSNLGVGGGILGVTGGQIGQFGNLGGQFGVQGNNQSQILIQVIAQMVAPGEWSNTYAGVGCDPNADPNAPPEPPDPNELKKLNSLGYYPVSNALIVRATSRYHPTQTFKFQPGDVGAMVNAVPRPRNVAAADPNVMERLANMNLPANDGRAIVKATGTDPKKVWNEVFKPGVVTEPSLVINAVDFLFEYKEYQQAAESLKANLRRGHATGAWAYEALSIALAASKANSAEVERAALSAIDLDPQDPRAYLRAAKAEHDLGKSEVAIDLCKRAAALEPNLPAIYANALVYADAPNAGDVKSDVVSWATKNLLRRDWPNDGVDHAKTAKESVGRIAKKLLDADRKADADAVLATVAEEKNRDLMIELRWQGQADLDLAVAEPTGTDCTAVEKRTAGGGVLRSDILEQQDENRAEVYTAASAFSGKYKVTVSSSLGRAIGNKATLKVTKFAGTDKEEVDVYTVDLAKPAAVEITLDGGTRHELATVIPDDVSSVRQISTHSGQVGAATGVTAGFGAADPATLNATNTPASAKNTAPLVGVQNEKRLAGVSPVLPGVRLISRVKPGSDVAEYFAQPVFAGKAVDIPLPKVPLLPGAGD